VQIWWRGGQRCGKVRGGLRGLWQRDAVVCRSARAFRVEPRSRWSSGFPGAERVLRRAGDAVRLSELAYWLPCEEHRALLSIILAGGRGTGSGALSRRKRAKQTAGTGAATHHDSANRAR